MRSPGSRGHPWRGLCPGGAWQQGLGSCPSSVGRGRHIHTGWCSLWPRVTHSRATCGVCPHAVATPGTRMQDARTGLCPTVSLGCRAGGSQLPRQDDRPRLSLLQGFATLQMSFTSSMVSCGSRAMHWVPPMCQAWPHLGHHMGSPCPGCGLGTGLDPHHTTAVWSCPRDTGGLGWHGGSMPDHSSEQGPPMPLCGVRR